MSESKDIRDRIREIDDEILDLLAEKTALQRLLQPQGDEVSLETVMESLGLSGII